MDIYDEVLGEVIPDDEYLEHYGVLGMKWGIRRYQPYPKGDGPKGRFIGEKAKSAASAVGRGVSSAARTTKNRVVTDKKAYDAKAPERAGARDKRRRERAAKKWEKKISSDKKRAYKNMGRLSDEELNARIDRLRREKEFKSLTEEVVYPGKKKVAQYMDRVVNKVLDKSVDKAFEIVEKELFPKSPAERRLDDLKYRADVAKAQSPIAKSNATIAESNAKIGKASSKSDSESASGAKGVKGEKWGVRESSSEPKAASSTKTSSESKESTSSSKLSSEERAAQLARIQRHKETNQRIQQQAAADRIARQERAEARAAEEREQQQARIQRHQEQNDAIARQMVEDRIKRNNSRVGSISNMSRYSEKGSSITVGHRDTRLRW